MSTGKRRRTVSSWLSAAAAVLALTASGCSGSSDSDSKGSGGSGKTVTMGVIPGWTDGLSTTYLLENILESNGYTVKITKLSDNDPMYAALANGDIDILSSAWPERTQK